MIALIRYALATTLHAQRYLAPVLLYFGAVGISSGDNSGPMAGVYALNSAILLICAAWLTMTVLNAAEPAHRAITITAARGPVRVLLADILVALLLAAGLMLIGLFLPLALMPRPLTGPDLLTGALTHLLCASIGLGIGLLCSRLVIRRQGWALIIALAAVACSLLITGTPPNLLFKALATTTHADDALPLAAGLFPLGLAILALAATATHQISIRKD
ncbi:hypothetical protein [Actinokineospora enzanensis]|uniref:hypothetical protein n=1 Tax=Actinokineospora enzanensis TaxID=155975 RepID=UPI00035FF629|nr:hypothetical protein [Actinokineospora enzanensis]